MKNIYFLILAVFSIGLYSCEPVTYHAASCTSGYDYNDVINISEYSEQISLTYAIADNGVVQLITIDHGCIFQNIPVPTTEDLIDVEGDLDGIVIVGTNGTILKGDVIDNDSLILSLASSGTNKSLNAVMEGFVPGSFISTGDSGTILKSTDFGENWYSVSSGTMEDLNTIDLTYGHSSVIISVSGENCVYLKSFDNGETWIVNNPISNGGFSGIPAVINSIFFIDENTGWAAGSEGKIFKTTDAGNSWSTQPSGITQNINKIIINSFLYGYAAADSGRVLFTTNGGINWLAHPSFDTITTKNINSFIQSDSVTFIAVGDSTVISITTDQPTSPLTGTISVGPSGQFTEVNTATSAAAFLGVTDSVNFVIEPGIYNEEIEIRPVFPIESKIRIDGGGAVELAKDMSDTSNFTLKISGAKNVIIENLTISNLDTGKGRVVLFEGDVSNVLFNNVVFNGPVAFTSAFSRSLVMSDGLANTKLTNIEFNNCTFNKGTFGLRFFSTGANNYFSGLNVKNCIFKNSSQASIILNFNENFLIASNTIDSSLQGFAFVNSRNFEVSRNKIYTTNTALVLQSCNTTNQNRNLISNNFFVSNIFGMSLLFSNSNNDFYHNSFNIQNPYDTSSLPGTTNITIFAVSATNNNIRNNIFTNKRKGLAVSISSGGIPFSSINYNDYYTNGDTLAQWSSGYHTTLSSFKTASGRDTNSVSRNVSFAASKDLHLAGASNGDTLLKTLPLSSVTTDIDESARSLISPYMGADEGTIPFNSRVLKLKIKFEAYIHEDTISVQIRNPASPFNLIETKTGLGGQAVFKQIYFSSVVNGSPYYLKVTHRNSIETWSSGTPSFSNDSLVYDFTTSVSMAFGNNMILSSGNACIYAGDANQDGNVDVTDLLDIYNNANNFVAGYVPTDINGDGFTDASDLIIAYNNSKNFVRVMRP